MEDNNANKSRVGTSEPPYIYVIDVFFTGEEKGKREQERGKKGSVPFSPGCSWTLLGAFQLNWKYRASSQSSHFCHFCEESPSHSKASKQIVIDLQGQLFNEFNEM